MNRRNLLKRLALASVAFVPVWRAMAASPANSGAGIEALRRNWKDFLADGADVALTREPLKRPDAEWKGVLTPAQFAAVLRELLP